MVKDELTLKELRRALASEKARARIMTERRTIQRQLKSLRAGPGSRILKRTGRGLIILTKEGAKATGRGIVKARKFAEETGAGEGLDIQLASSLQRRPRRIVRVIRRRSPGRTSVIRRVTTTRRTKVRPRTRRVVRRRRANSNNDFFGNFSDLGI